MTNTPHIGSLWTKHPIGHQAQVSALTHTHAIMYWPRNNTQTYVSLARFRRTTEWQPAP